MVKLFVPKIRKLLTQFDIQPKCIFYVQPSCRNIRWKIDGEYMHERFIFESPDESRRQYDHNNIRGCQRYYHRCDREAPYSWESGKIQVSVLSQESILTLALTDLRRAKIVRNTQKSAFYTTYNPESQEQIHTSSP